jgi:hypothetical protein
VAVAALFGLVFLVPTPDAGGLMAQVAYLAGAGVVGGGTFMVMAYLLRVNELRDLWQQGRSWWKALIRNS